MKIETDIFICRATLYLKEMAFLNESKIPSFVSLDFKKWEEVQGSGDSSRKIGRNITLLIPVSKKLREAVENKDQKILSEIQSMTEELLIEMGVLKYKEAFESIKLDIEEVSPFSITSPQLPQLPS